MKRRAYIIGTLVAVAAVNMAQTSRAYCRIVTSTQNFQRYYHDLQEGQHSLGPIESAFFSLVLANSRSPEQTTTGETPAGRT